MTAAAHPDAMRELLTWLSNWWWLFLVFGGSIAAFFGQMWEGLCNAFGAIGRTRHRRRLELYEAMTKAQGAWPPRVQLAKPGPCVHRNVTAVMPTGDGYNRPVAWLCVCGAQLPADWAVRQEDL